MAFRLLSRAFRNTPVQYFFGTAIAGGILVQAFGFVARSNVAQTIMNSDVFRDAKIMARKHPGTEYLFGKPLNFKALDADNRKRQYNIIYSSSFAVWYKKYLYSDSAFSYEEIIVFRGSELGVFIIFSNTPL